MTEIFTQPPAGGPTPGQPPSGGSTDKKLTALIGVSVLFLVAALGTLGWVVLSTGDGGEVVAAAQAHRARTVIMKPTMRWSVAPSRT